MFTLTLERLTQWKQSERGQRETNKFLALSFKAIVWPEKWPDKSVPGGLGSPWKNGTTFEYNMPAGNGSLTKCLQEMAAIVSA